MIERPKKMPSPAEIQQLDKDMREKQEKERRMRTHQAEQATERTLDVSGPAKTPAEIREEIERLFPDKDKKNV